MAHTPYDLIMHAGATTTATAPRVGIGGTGFRYGQSVTGLAVANKPNQNLANIYTKHFFTLSDTTTGGTCTVVVEDSSNDSSYTTLMTVTLTIAAGVGVANTIAKRLLLRSNRPFIRHRITAISGGSAPTLNSYFTLGTYGSA